LIEVLVAFSILLGGITLFLWQMRQQSIAAQRQEEYLFALECAQSDLESLQAMPPEWVHDTSYSLQRASGKVMHLVRLVYDTADFEAGDEHLKLDSLLHPLALKEPREVQVKVYRKEENQMDSDFSFGWGRGLWGANQSDTLSPIVQLTLRIPEYLP
jgi:type II secretory pathway pseudopilin PulG